MNQVTFVAKALMKAAEMLEKSWKHKDGSVWDHDENGRIVQVKPGNRNRGRDTSKWTMDDVDDDQKERNYRTHNEHMNDKINERKQKNEAKKSLTPEQFLAKVLEEVVKTIEKGGPGSGRKPEGGDGTGYRA